MEISEKMLDELRARVSKDMSEKRARHTLEVETMVSRLARLYAPEKENILRAAALLHDITKEYKTDRQLEICEKYGIRVEYTDLYAPKTFHARTAAALIPELYPEFADEEIISCIRYHTTGRAGMTLCEKLVYLADYIDMSRTFPDCVTLRNYFFEADPHKMSEEERLCHLDRTMILSYDMTVRGLMEDGSPVSEDTFRARNELVIAQMRK